MSSTFGQKFTTEMKLIKQCNILVIGNTGVGKSTLISKVLGVPISNSITQEISKKPYQKPGLPIAIYDTPGLESNDKQQKIVKQEIANLIRNQKKEEIEKQIHAVWYCINSQANRPDYIDSAWIELISKEVPVIAVITRASGIEKSWLEPNLESITSIKKVVPVMAERETTLHYDIKPYGFNSLLNVTENLLKEITQTAILNDINAKAERSLVTCLLGSVPIIAARLTIGGLPFIPSVVTAGLQTLLLTDISKHFGYEFEPVIISELYAVSTSFNMCSGISFNTFFEQCLNNIPNHENIKTVHDALSQLIVMLNGLGNALPFQNELLQCLTNLDHLPILNGLPILNCITAISNILSTLFMGIAYIEALKVYKKLEYEGQPLPDIKEVLKAQMQELMKVVQCWFGGGIVSSIAA